MNMGGLIGIDAILGLYSSALAFPVPQPKWIPLCKPLVMPAVRTKAGQGEIHLAVEFQFLWDDLEGRGTLFITTLFGG